MPGMAKAKPPAEPDERPSGRQPVKYVALPLDLWEELFAISESEERSISWVARKIVRRGLDALKEEGGRP